jgi:hypothetical protein
MEFKIDYLTATSSVPSGYASLGVGGGDGGMILGNKTDVVSAVTSLDDNFNKFGCVLTVNSPETDSSYTPDPACPNWIYDVWYEVTVKTGPFVGGGFGEPRITGIHASPSKVGTNECPVVEVLCPPTPTPTPTGPTPTPTVTPTPRKGEKCWQCTTYPQVEAVTWWIFNLDGTITIHTTFSKNFVDNTYGVNAIGWPKGHTFGNLTGSDHLQLALYDASNSKRMEFKIDYLTATSSAPSGYASLGVSGGDGKMIKGNKADVVEAVTSLDVNFNAFGYVLTVNSPATDSSYDPNLDVYPDWIYDVWYEVTVKPVPFAAGGGFGEPRITGIHASPSKVGTNECPVVEVPCP